MEVACDDRYHCKQVLGFFVNRKSPQFSIVSNFTQNARVVVSPIDVNVSDVRLVLVHHYARGRGRVVGFTSENNEKSEYYFSGVIPFGRIVMVPIACHDGMDVQCEGYVTVFEEDDGCLVYTKKAEDALEYLFVVLDADNNGFLSASEMSVFKEFLGLRRGITEDEWSDALFGWVDGDLDYTLTEMSLSFFKTFIVRLCQGYFNFSEAWPVQQETPDRMTTHARRIRNLERIFKCFGFNKDLEPGFNRYRIRVYTEQSYMSKFSVIPRERVTPEIAIKCITKLYGVKKMRRDGLVVYILKCPNWCSALVKNTNVEPMEVIVEYFQSTWRKVVAGDGEMVGKCVSSLSNVGSVSNSIERPHPCKILHRPFQHVQHWHLQNLLLDIQHTGEDVKTSLT